MAKIGDIFHVFKVPNPRSKRIKKAIKAKPIPQIDPENESTFSSVLDTEQERKKELNRKFSQTFRDNQNARLQSLRRQLKQIRTEIQSAKAINKQLNKRNLYLRSNIRRPDGRPLTDLSRLEIEKIRTGTETDLPSQAIDSQQTEFYTDNFLVSSQHLK